MPGDTTTALAFALPENLIDFVNEIRNKHDRAAKRWPPHINFLFPFIPLSEFEDVREKLQGYLQNEFSFELVLDELSFFSQGRGKITFHLKPNKESEQKLQSLFAIIQEALPGISSKKEFHPHLTLGQCLRSEWPEIERELQSWLGTGIITTCEKVVMYHRSVDTGDRMVEKKNVSLLDV